MPPRAARTPKRWSSNNSTSTAASPSGGGFSLELLDERPGFVLAQVVGPGAVRRFAHEAGGHRWQRVPPSEKRGRVHTSTITVAVLPEPRGRAARLDASEIDETFTGGGGKGGQHQNKRSTAVVLVHRPTRIRVRIEGRSQDDNRRLAREVLTARLAALETARRQGARNDTRREQIGSGMRGDKIRTIAVRKGVVTCHRRGTRIAFRAYARGEWNDLDDKPDSQR